MSEYREKYPWLRTISLYTGKVDPECDAMDDIPEGWRIAFGDLFCEEMDAAIKKAGLEDEFVFLQVKEKFGQLRCYYQPINDEISNIISKYEALSGNICIVCGKPDVPMINGGWISPFCKECYCEKLNHDEEIYDKCSSKNRTMTNTISYRRYMFDNETGKRVEETKEIDVKNTADEIRKRWKEKQKKVNHNIAC